VRSLSHSHHHASAIGRILTSGTYTYDGHRNTLIASNASGTYDYDGRFTQVIKPLG
jgi:hypothetical protein